MAENIYNYKIVTNGDMASTVTSPAVDLSKTDGYSVYAKWTGAAAAGSINLEVSLNDINFVPMFSGATSVAGPGDALWEITTAFYDKIRVVFTPTGGSVGVLNVQINGKGDRI